MARKCPGSGEAGGGGGGADAWESQKQLLEQEGALIHREQQRLLREQTSGCVRDIGVLQRAVAALDATCGTRLAELSSGLDDRAAELAEASGRARREREDADARLAGLAAELEAGLEGLREELRRGLRVSAERSERAAEEQEAWRLAMERRLGRAEQGLSEHTAASSEQAVAQAELQLRVSALDEGLGGTLRDLGRCIQEQPGLRQRLDQLERGLGEQPSLRRRLEELEQSLGAQAGLHREVQQQHTRSWEALDTRQRSGLGELSESCTRQAGALADLQSAFEQERACRGAGADALGGRLDRVEAEARGQSALAVRLATCEADVQELRERLGNDAERPSCRCNTGLLADVQKVLADLTAHGVERSEQQALLVERVEGVERVLRSSQEALMDDLHARLGEVGADVAAERETRVSSISEVWERLSEFEGMISDAVGKHRGGAYSDMPTPDSQATTIGEGAEELLLSRGCEAMVTDRVHGHLAEVSDRVDQLERSLRDLADRHVCELRELQARSEPTHGKPADLPRPVPAALTKCLEDLEAHVSFIAQQAAEERAALGHRLDGLADRLAVEGAAREAQCGLLDELLGREREHLGADLAGLGRRLELLEGTGRHEAPAPEPTPGACAHAAAERPQAHTAPACARAPQEVPAAPARAAATVEACPHGVKSAVQLAPGPVIRRVQSVALPAVQQAGAQGQSGLVRAVSEVFSAPKLQVGADAFSRMDVNGDGVVTRAEFGQFQLRQAEAVGQYAVALPAAGNAGFIRLSSVMRSP